MKRRYVALSGVVDDRLKIPDMNDIMIQQSLQHKQRLLILEAKKCAILVSRNMYAI